MRWSTRSRRSASRLRLADRGAGQPVDRRAGAAVSRSSARRADVGGVGRVDGGIEWEQDDRVDVVDRSALPRRSEVHRGEDGRLVHGAGEGRRRCPPNHEAVVATQRTVTPSATAGISVRVVVVRRQPAVGDFGVGVVAAGSHRRRVGATSRPPQRWSTCSPITCLIWSRVSGPQIAHRPPGREHLRLVLAGAPQDELALVESADRCR